MPPLDPSLKDALLIASAQAARMAVGILASVVAARVLGPEGMGVAAMALAIAGVTVALSEPGLRAVTGRDVAVALVAGDAPAAIAAIQRYLGARLGLALPLAALACLVAMGSPAALGLPPDRALGAVLGLVVVGIILGQHAQAATEMASAFRSTAGVVAGAGTTRAAVILGLAAVGALTPVTLVGVEGVAGLLTALMLAMAGPPLPGIFRPRFAGVGALIRRSAWLGIGVVAALVLARVDVLALAGRASMAEVGIYGVAAGLAARADLLKNAILTVWYPRLSAAGPSELSGLMASARRTAARVGMLLFPYGLVAVGALWWGAGDAYVSGVVPLVFLLTAVLVQLLVEPEALVLYAHAPRVVAATDLILLAIAAGAAWWAAGIAGPGGVAAALLLARLVVSGAKLLAARAIVERMVKADGAKR